MRIIITGAAGFIGSHLAQTLKKRGHEVIGIDCFTDYYSRALKELNATALRDDGIQISPLDLVEDPLEEALGGAEIVYHFAAQPGNLPSIAFETYLRNNIVATRRLTEAAMQVDSLKCFINVATSSVYGKQATDPEDVAPKPISYYGVTKLAAEQLVLAQQRDKGFPACSIRIFSVYGPRERPEKLYPKLIDSILHEQEFPLFEGSLEHSRSFTYVDDAVQGFVAVLDHIDDCIGEIFNIGSDIEITTGRGIQIVEDLIGRKAKMVMKPRRSGDQVRTYANIDKAKRILGYAPLTTPEEGLRAEVEWYQRHVFGKIDLS